MTLLDLPEGILVYQQLHKIVMCIQLWIRYPVIMYLCMCMCMCVFVHVFVHACMWGHACLCAYVLLCVCVHLYVVYINLIF